MKMYSLFVLKWKRSDASICIHVVCWQMLPCTAWPTCFIWTLDVSLVMNGCTAGWAIPVTEWAASDERLHLDSGSRPPRCPLHLSGDSCRLLHLCSPCKSEEQLEWPDHTEPYPPNLLLPLLPDTVTVLMTIPLLTPGGVTVKPLVSSSQRCLQCLTIILRSILKQELMQVWVGRYQKRTATVTISQRRNSFEGLIKAWVFIWAHYDYFSYYRVKTFWWWNKDIFVLWGKCISTFQKTFLKMKAC